MQVRPYKAAWPAPATSADGMVQQPSDKVDNAWPAPTSADGVDQQPSDNADTASPAPPASADSVVWQPRQIRRRHLLAAGVVGTLSTWALGLQLGLALRGSSPSPLLPPRDVSPPAAPSPPPALPPPPSLSPLPPLTPPQCLLNTAVSQNLWNRTAYPWDTSSYPITAHNLSQRQDGVVSTLAAHLNASVGDESYRYIDAEALCSTLHIILEYGGICGAPYAAPFVTDTPAAILQAHGPTLNGTIVCPGGKTSIVALLDLCTTPCFQDPHRPCCLVPAAIAAFFPCCREQFCCPDQQR